MFETARVPLRVADVSPRKPINHDEREVPLVEITFELNPLSAELAAELDDVVKRVLFTMRDVDVNPKVGSVGFNLSFKPQEISVHAAPDVSDPSFVIEEAKMSGFRATRSKKSSAWTLVFTATCSPAHDHQLGQIVDSYLKTRYCTFENAAPGLFDEIEKEQRKASKDAKPVRASSSAAAEGATAH